MRRVKAGGTGQTLFVTGVAAIAALVVLAAWLGPTGCQSSSTGEAAIERPGRPRSPLDDAIDLRKAAAPEEQEVVRAPEPPEERPLPPTSEPMVRVRIAVLKGDPAELSLSRGSFEVSEVGSEGAPPRRFASPLSIANEGGAWVLREGRGSARREHRMAHTQPIEVRSLDAQGRGPGSPIAFGEQTWPGIMRLHARSDPPGGIDLVVLVELERYLPGVLAKELYRSWALETYRAQAIAARSYAVAEAAHWAKRRHFDMVAGEASQAWIGETEHANARRAVDDTRGMLLIYEGRVVPAYYSSCCGGSAADAIEAVTRNPNHDIPPLAIGRDERGRRPNCCRKSPTFEWSEALPVDEFMRRLTSWGRENGRSDLASLQGLTAISVASSNAAGRTRTVDIVDGAGRTIALPAEVLRAAMNGAPADPARSASAEYAPRRTLKSSNVDVTLEGDSVVFTGHGHGHGVGLCQYGAESMARAGRSWKEILVRYYPGAAPSRCW